MAGESVGIDVGGTKIAGVRVDGSGAVLARAESPSPAQDPEALVAGIVSMVERLGEDGVVAVGVGAAGMVEAQTGVMRYAPNLAWRDLPLRERVAAATGLPVLVDNDANVAAWGEYRFGAGRGSRHMLLVTVGTGIGGGVVLHDRLFRGAHGFAGEIGHVIVEPDGPLCGCGNRGCWEQMASGRAIDRLARRAAEDDPAGSLVAFAGGDPSAVDGRVVTRAAAAGEPTAVAILEEVGRRLGSGIAGFVNVLDVELVVVGGGAAEAGDLLLEPARAAYHDAVQAPEHRPGVPIVAAELGNDAGALGAAALALEELRAGQLG